MARCGDSTYDRAMELPLRALSAALGESVLPGVYALTGPIGCGKTQLALQIAAHADRVTLAAPRIDPREIGARLAGIRMRHPWLDLEGEPLPGSIQLVHQLPAAGGLLIADHFSEDPAVLVGRARRAAIDQGAIALVVLEPSNAEAIKGFVPQEILRRSPGEIAEWIGVPVRAAAEVDALMVLAPDRARTDEGWMTLELVVAKRRRGVPGRAVLRFNGTWFEDDKELELQL